MAPSKAISALAPWFARICGNTQARAAAVAEAENPEWLEKAVKGKRQEPPTLLTTSAATAAKLSLPIPAKEQPARNREVQIDVDTAVPYDLYKDLVRAGKRAKARGQHELKVSPVAGATSARNPRKKMHLVCPQTSAGTW